ncbi:hypothetical protein Dacet_2612 [Denitrovibrio acetiphilus DSM 12809]|jgi:hypothetical protein|uniref:Uncharacterized protein n=1 Tax=Denitrovibrio acetiphilus (strain DSM 12809 / NBRC 114555 / N2460) TaxID=522772 RepID=D4H514_DENA2|nr:hypothetical protein Dacet_2612 [Denitrovibrio acetiphilus DSM 12809]
MKQRLNGLLEIDIDVEMVNLVRSKFVSEVGMSVLK